MDISHLPRKPGVYLMRDAAGDIIYIGKAKDLRARVAQYFRKQPAVGGGKIPCLSALIRKIDYISLASEREALVAERKLISRYRPFFNVMWKDSKSYPFLKITLKEDFPRIFLTRKKEKDGGLYFGPYPRVSSVEKLINHLRRIKFINMRRCERILSSKDRPGPLKTCVYFHTGGCPAPCSGKIGKTEYARSVKRTIDFLRGNFEDLLKKLDKEMRGCSLRMRYEEAALLRDFIKAVGHLAEKTRIGEFDGGFVDEELKKSAALTGLMNVLRLPGPPAHIEAFDTSSLFGKNPVGSSVCFVNALRHPGHYRKYRIRFKNPDAGSDDIGMIGEIVSRRISRMLRDVEPLPDLLLIDGGAGQLAAAGAALKGLRVEIPTIALAKGFEEIYTAGNEKPLRLDAADPALLLLRAIRDEAHRFGVRYHRSLRDGGFAGEK